MDVEVAEDLPENHNLKCHVCGENQFEEREGFYYCQECGTKQEQVRAIEFERDDDEFDQNKVNTKKQKIKLAEVEKPKLTSWECYNYILRGFVEELLSFGAKEELKLMTLQVWAAYLRRMQVAFFNRKQADLPKLGIKYLKNDAETIYNHKKQVRKKRQRKCSEDTSCASANESRSFRKWNKSKRKLDESIYSLTSATSGGSGFTSSTSANSNRAIKIGFSAKARSFYKRKMPVKHLEKHLVDADGVLKCHKQPTARQINRTDYNLMLINTKQIYSILAIALNLIGDDVQLCDLVRFINEKHIGSSNVLQYFPEEIANNGKEMLTKINFYKCPEKFSDKSLRDHIGTLCKNIGVHTLRQPDIKKLVQRYTKELCLPVEVAHYIERLINLLPPNFNTRVDGYYPGFEARAMAYIIFTMKLLFGLDDFKENRMSQATKVLNLKIEKLNHQNNEKQPLLFVWSDWMEYIEMRKVIISQFNTSFCEQFKQCQSTNQVLQQMAEEIRVTQERNSLLNDATDNLPFLSKMKNLKSLFERFQENYQQSVENNKPPVFIDFKPSLTPAFSYLKNIMLLCNNQTNTNSNSSLNFKIPDFMHTDHSQRDINCFLQVKPLIKYFKRHQLNLKVHVLGTTENRQHIGIFRTPVSHNKKQPLRKACTEVTEEEWDEIVMDRAAQGTDDLQFYAASKSYTENYHNRLLQKKQFFNPFMNYDLNLIHDDAANKKRANETTPERQQIINNDSAQNCNKEGQEDLQSIYSFEKFSENNMDPVDAENFIKEPRRNLDKIDLFEDISDEESVLNYENDSVEMNTMNNSQSRVVEENDSLPILPEFIKQEPESPKLPGLNMSYRKPDRVSKSNDILKLYISNMDCWMLLGNILKTTNAQKSQLQGKFSRSFNWLLETCAQTISVEWSAVFEQLICLETMFCLGINDPKTIKNCVYVNSQNPNKELQMIINTCRDIW